NPILGDVIVSYFWEFGDGATDTLVNPTHTYQNMGSYAVTLTVTTQFGCEGVFSRFVIVDPPDIDLLIPSAFTPNATGSSGGTYDPSSFDNDVFYPITTFVEEYDLQVFNRWGELVFVSNDLQIGWDGYYKEKLSQQDTYIWKLKIVWITGKEYEDVGRVLLIR
ncbi:MAG: gliding motility-associated C-terminal domain-containing protein, partial [Flavobacteriales bacterium]|nr:gliding motility-associated C-terminal domain-containing protein [Flavobacteriales bacterium]